MMRRIGYFILLCSLLPFAHLTSTPRQGGNGLLYIQSAKVLPKGYLEFFAGTRYYGKISSGGNSAFTLWNLQGFTSFNLGIGSHMELGITPILYQDTNSDDGNVMDGQANLPDDIFIMYRLGSFGSFESPFLFGGALTARIPTGQDHNIIYEPYSAGKFSIGLKGMVSYYSNVLFPDEGWSLHGNIEYFNHNDVGAELTDDENDPQPTSMTSELVIGLGFHYPSDPFAFSAEININTFMVRPPETAYSRESVAYLTAGIYYQPYPWFTLEMGIDFRLYAGEDISNYEDTSLPNPPADFPNYPGWRGTLGMKFGILPTSLHQSSEKARLEREAADRRAILERMMKGQKDTEDADSELTKIRAERQRVEEELKRLRKLLEEEKKKNEKGKGKGEGKNG